MPSVMWSLAGMRRRAAIWLIAAWAVFGVSQALAICCVDAMGTAPSSAGSAAHHEDAAAHDHCGEASGDSTGNASGPPCLMTLGETPPPAATAILPVLVQGPYAYPVPSTREFSHQLAVAAPSEPAAYDTTAASPPDPIYLRLQRFLI